MRFVVLLSVVVDVADVVLDAFDVAEDVVVVATVVALTEVGGHPMSNSAQHHFRFSRDHEVRRPTAHSNCSAGVVVWQPNPSFSQHHFLFSTGQVIEAPYRQS